jgi:DNA-3-methyladenine glycosylase
VRTKPCLQPFYERPTLEVAPDLLGKYLLRRLGDSTIAARIVEVEAYVGPEDRACHAARGRTARTEVMFGPGGRAYVYMIYGMYFCLNLVTEAEGFPAAVLIRAVEASEGIPTGVRLDGPGRLCRALGINRAQNGLSVCDERSGLWVEDRGGSQPVVACGPRIGVDYAGESAAMPWRFWDADSHLTSRSSRSPRGTAARRSPPVC